MAEHPAGSAGYGLDQYLRRAGHELRTPLTSIVASASILALSADLPAEAGRFVEVIARNSRRLADVIDALLDLAALDHDVAVLRPVRLDLADMVRMAVAGLPADRQVSVNLPAVLPLDADAGRLAQVLAALRDNAVAFTRPGDSIAVGLTTVGPFAELVIADTGIGVPEEEFPLVFEPLHRSSRADEQQIPGVGLGLPISRRIAELHHGTLDLLPTAGGGVAAVLCLPLPQGPARSDGGFDVAQAVGGNTGGAESRGDGRG
ncbi:HAMP domain-containing sensor histidine kinase [Actinoplanes sp. NPDC051851]|uniref:sensor histidine kinase n=1 Tax=Actinoplanes sp. NPDC051851 TaxID=3154753 RepID=UPI00341827FC